MLIYVFDGDNCSRFFLDSFVDDAKTTTYRMLALQMGLDNKSCVTCFPAPRVPGN